MAEILVLHNQNMSHLFISGPHRVLLKPFFNFYSEYYLIKRPPGPGNESTQNPISLFSWVFLFPWDKHISRKTGELGTKGYSETHLCNGT